MAMSNDALENEVKNLGKIIADIRDNHLHTIYKELKELNLALMRRLPPWVSVAFSTMSAIIAGLVVYGCMR